MQKKFFSIVLVCTLFLFFCSLSAYSQGEESLSFKELIDLGKDAINQEQYEKAILYFKLAHLANPSSDEPRQWVNFVKRIQEGRVAIVELKSNIVELKPFPQTKTKEFPPGVPTEETTGTTKQKLFPPKKGERQKKQAAPSVSTMGEWPAPRAQAKGSPGAVSAAPIQSKDIDLNDELWLTQPDTALNLEIQQEVTLKGENIEKFLVVSPQFISVERLDSNRIKIIGLLRGGTFLHVWDARGRWTFNVNVNFPAQILTPAQQKAAQYEVIEPFRFGYASDWSSYYIGNNLPNLERQNLHFTQITNIAGNTPYGNFDTYTIFNRFGESTEVTGYSVGLTNGQIGNFKNFSIRGFDASQAFSPLTLEGKYFRGVLLNAEAFNRNINYTVLWGRESLLFGYLASDPFGRVESFIEGGRVTLFPHDSHQYSLNYAQGYGSHRADYLKKRAYSVVTEHKFAKAFLASELAYDEDNFAGLIRTEFGTPKNRLNLNFRDIDKDFVTVTNFPANRGEVGGTAVWSFTRPHFDVYSNLDLYQDNFLPNQDHPDSLNYDLSTSAGVALSQDSNWRSSIYYQDTPGVLSPHRNFRLNNTLSKMFRILNDRYLSTFIGVNYQRSRFTLSPSSEFDRYSATAGFRLPLIKNLSYFADYEYSWLEEKLSGDHLNPQVFSTGLNYSKELSKFWMMDMGLFYRNEQEADSLLSFLAGEDSLTGNIGFNFRPTDDFQFFIDTRLRNVWAESPSRSAYNEADIRWGIRSSWDLPFNWSPVGTIEGTVFNDLNQNKIQDRDEPGVSGVTIRVGNSTVVSDHTGWYQKKVRAKKISIDLDLATVPDKYIVSTSMYENVEIFHHQTQKFNFPLTSHSGIYGVVYYDQNHNGQLDSQDVLIPRIKISLDNRETTITDFQGVYFFNDISEGQHTVFIDVNSLPMEYLPLIKISNTFHLEEGTTYVLHVPLKLKR